VRRRISMTAVIARLLDSLERQLTARRQMRRHLELRSAAACDDTVQFLPDATVWNAGHKDCINVGAFTMICGNISTVTTGARLAIGHHCFIGAGSRISAYERITIRSHVLISHMVDIHDADGHPIDWEERRHQPKQLLEGLGVTDYGSIEKHPVTIEDDVWIGFKSTILKGVTIGRGAIVAAASLVTKDVEPFTLVAGNPARVVRTLDESVAM
jgi:acetyltransferase-like isoleucine patch superfamily enzyme